jgi:quinol monooxygenase YgiN
MYEESPPMRATPNPFPPPGLARRLAALCLFALAGSPATGLAADGGAAASVQPPPGIAAVAALAAEARRDGVDEGAPVCVAALYTIQAGHEDEAAEDLHRLAALTRQEAGNLLYIVHRSLEDPHQFLIYEQYRSRSDLDAHRKTPYFQRYSVEGLQKIAESRTTGSFTPF